MPTHAFVRDVLPALPRRSLEPALLLAATLVACGVEPTQGDPLDGTAGSGDGAAGSGDGTVGAPDEPLDGSADALADAPGPVAIGCPAGDPSCSGEWDVEHTSRAYTLGASPTEVTLCADLPHAVGYAFASDGTISVDAFLPKDGGLWGPGVRPLVVFGAGNAKFPLEYDALLSHLASHGFIAVSVIVPFAGSVDRRAQIAHCALRHIVDDADWGAHIDRDSIVLGGHSRGGEGAVMVANRLATSTHAIDMSLDVPVVFGVAPSMQCEAGDEAACGSYDAQGGVINAAEQAALVELTHLSDNATDAYLVMQGSEDGDVDGQSLGLFDLASVELAPPLGPYMRKALVWSFGIPHSAWGGMNFSNGTSKGGTLGRAYVSAFLRWNIYGETDHAIHFQDNRQRPFCVAWPAACGLLFDAPDVFTEYVEGTRGGGSRKVIQDFEDGWDPRLPGTTSPAPGVDLALVTDVGNHRRSTALSVDGGVTQQDLTITLAPAIDVTRYDVLSLRVGVVPDAAACVSPPEAFDLTVGLTSQFGGNVHAAAVVASDYARLRGPDCEEDRPLSPGMPRPHAQTIRIPLIDFDGVDLEHIGKVTLSVDPATAGPSTPFFVDGIELVNNAVYCGNGEIEDQESCDGEDLDGKSCSDFGFVGGVLACDDICRFDTALCNDCGNGIIDAGEACDGNQFPAGMNCGDFGFAGGDLSCEASCTVIGTATCDGGASVDSPGSYADCLTPAQRADCEVLGPTKCAIAYGDIDCVGGPCRLTQPGDLDAGDLLDYFNEDGGEYHPDGNYRDDEGNLYYCMDVGGERRVCSDDDGWGVCSRCDGTNGTSNTLLGCPCAEADDCISFNVGDPSMSCWGAEYGAGPGTCWNDLQGPPDWQCPESACGQVPYWEEDQLFCEHYAHQASCQPVFACSPPESIVCAENGPGLLCDPNGNGCVLECASNAHCHEALGWPADFCCVSNECQYVNGGC